MSQAPDSQEIKSRRVELVLQQLDALPTLPAVVVRFFNTTGPRQVGSYGMVLPSFVASALRNDDIQIFGDGKQSRCFIDVRDVAEILPRLLAEPRAHGVVMNLGSDRSFTIEELADLVIRTLSSRSALGMSFIFMTNSPLPPPVSHGNRPSS